MVAPFAGAWIEIIDFWEQANIENVAPFAGAWIEISNKLNLYKEKYVAPFAGAWIEIKTSSKVNSLSTSRTLRGCVD